MLIDSLPDMVENMYIRLKEYRALQPEERVLRYSVDRKSLKPPKGDAHKEQSVELYPG